MANVQFSNATFCKRIVIGRIQTAESIRISVKNDIQQVISVGLDSAVNSYDANSGEAVFYGKTNIKFLYSDGTSLNSSNYNSDFTASVISENITPESKLTFDVVTVDSKVDTSANTATLTILLEVTVYGYVTHGSPYLSSGEDVYVKTESLEVLQGAEVVNLATVIDEELNASKNISTVLVAESNLCVTDYTLNAGVLRISGDATVRLTYLSDGDITCDVLPFKFERELDASEISTDSQIRLCIFPKNTKVRLDISEEINTAFTVEIAANVRVEATKLGVIDVICDAYGASCDFDFDKTTVCTTLPCGSVVANKTVVASVEQEDNKTPLVAVNAGAVVTKCVSSEKQATVDGVVFATVLYSTDTGVIGEQLEIPFSQNVEVNFLGSKCTSYANVTVSDFNVVSKSGGLLVTAQLCITIDSERQMEYTLIVGAEERPFDKKQLPAMEICLARRGETLWALAKNLHMSQDDLLASNPEIKNPLDKDARIVVFNAI